MESSTGEIVETVVLAVADATERDALSLPPLGTSIDPDVLHGLVQQSENGTLTFTYASREVTVTHEGDVRVSTILPVRGATTPAASGPAGD